MTDPGGVRLRDGVEADAEKLFALDQQCFAAGVAYPQREFRRLLRSRRSLCVVAEAAGEIAGFVIAREAMIRQSRGGHIITLDVAGSFRRRGIGRMLMANVEERLRAGGAAWLRLEVAENNPPAHSFYLGLDFAPVGTMRNYYEGAIDAIVMIKALGPPTG